MDLYVPISLRSLGVYVCHFRVLIVRTWGKFTYHLGLVRVTIPMWRGDAIQN